MSSAVVVSAGVFSALAQTDCRATEERNVKVPAENVKFVYITRMLGSAILRVPW